METNFNFDKPVATFVPREVPFPSDNYLAGRNGAVGEAIATNLGVNHLGVQALVEENLQGFLKSGYAVLPKPTRLALAEAAGVSSGDVQSIYGGAYLNPSLVDKTTLHPSVEGRPVFSFVDARFQKEIAGLVLPGFSITSPAEAEQAYELLSTRGVRTTRLKSADSSNGEDQFVVNSAAEARFYYESLGQQYAVIEEQVQTENGLPPENISVGLIRLPNGQDFTVINSQIDIPGANGQVIYGGGNCSLYRGNLLDLKRTVCDNHARTTNSEAILNSIEFLELFLGCHENVTTRISVDTLAGKVTDISARCTGADPFVHLAIGQLVQRPDLHAVSGYVHLNYGRDQFADLNNGQQESLRFIDPNTQGSSAHDLQIVAQITSGI